MNHLIVNSRAFYNEFINDASFSSDLTDYSTTFKALNLERTKLSLSVNVWTEFSASSTAEILFVDLGADATFTHPYLNIATEGFKIGDTILIVKGASSIAATISNIQTNVLTCNDAGIAAALTIVSGTSYSDISIYNTTVPTSLLYSFGIVPNTLPPPYISPAPTDPYASWLDGQQQIFSADGIGAAPETMTFLSSNSANTTESLTAEYISTAADGYTFTFEIIHIFRDEFFKQAWLTNFINNTQPSTFSPPNSYRYQCRMLFGTSSTDPNEYRVFTDNFTNGSLGFINRNFTSGTGVYNLVSCAYADPGANEIISLEATIVNTVTIQIEKTSGNFPVGQKAIVYISKLPTDTEYSNSTDSWETIRIFDECTQTDGSASVDSTVITNLIVDVNATPSLLDITFDVSYSAAQQLLIDAGDRYFIGVLVGDATLPATTSDRKIVWCDCNVFTKVADIDGLISGLVFECYSSEKTPNGLLSTTNVDTWNNRLHMARVGFNLKKYASSNDSQITKMIGQVVFRDSVTGESFSVDDYNFNLGANTLVPVSGTGYQVKNITTQRDLSIELHAEARKVTVVSEQPVSFDANQAWTVRWPFVINWREWQYNPNVPLSFFDNTQDQNNLNYRTSNYDTGNWVMYIRLLVYVKKDGITTEYGLYSTPCVIRDFNAQPDGVHTWIATTKLYDENGIEVQDIIIDQDIRIETVFSEASVSGLVLANLFAEHTIEETGSLGNNCRLHSSVEWGYTGNILKPISGETYVKVTQDVLADTITVQSLIDKDQVDPTKSYNVYTHLQETR